MNPSSLPTHQQKSNRSLIEVQWKPCTKKCQDGRQYIEQDDGSKYGIECVHCQGHGVEPVAVKNPKNYYVGNSGEEYQLQLGKVFEIECSCLKSYYYGDFCCPDCGDTTKLKFLPIRPVKEGDLSSVWVVKV